jgi:hypothetical protein
MKTAGNAEQEGMAESEMTGVNVAKQETDN